MTRSLRESLALLKVLREPEPSPSEVDGIDFAWWPTNRLIEYALKHYDAMDEDALDAFAFEVQKRINEAYQDPKGS